MARKSYNTPRPDYYVTVGGHTKQGVPNLNSVEGYFLGSSTAPDPFNESKMKTTFLLKDAEGKVVGVNGNANLVFQFEDAKKNLAAEGLSIVGMQTYIDYVGERKSDKKGRSPTKLFKVDFDPEDVIEVSGAAAAAAGAIHLEDSDDVDYAAQADSDDLGSPDTEPPEALPVPNADQLSAAEREARAKALIAKSKSDRK